MRKICDILVIGSGFGGSLVARALAALGRDVMVIDSGRHPRFAIGESSTPTADLVLEALCDRFNWPDLKLLARYGSASQLAPQAIVGPKRGFAYFDATIDPQSPTDRRDCEMLVAASTDLATADTHWHRASVDQFLSRSLVAQGVPLYEGFQTQELQATAHGGWVLKGLSDQGPMTIEAQGIIDASGRRSPLAQALQLPETQQDFRTRSGAVFGHVRDWKPMGQILGETDCDQTPHPFPCDASALHHVAPDGWMWQLAFDSGVTSIGWCVSPESIPAPQDAASWWEARLNRFPTVLRSAEKYQRVEPIEHWIVAPRLQYRRQRCAGKNWWMLPSAAGFVDPLHSSGIAQTLVSVERIAAAFAASSSVLPPESFARRHDALLQREIAWIDRLVGACYEAFDDFASFRIASSLYFAAAIRFESIRFRNPAARPAFLAADDLDLQQAIEAADQCLTRARRARQQTSDTHARREIAQGCQAQVSLALRAIDPVGLLDPPAFPYLHRSAAPTKLAAATESSGGSGLH